MEGLELLNAPVVKVGWFCDGSNAKAVLEASGYP